METTKEPKCTLTDKELLEAAHKAISNMCQRQRWQMTVPVDFNRDSDMLLAEVCNRYESLLSQSHSNLINNELDLSSKKHFIYKIDVQQLRQTVTDIEFRRLLYKQLTVLSYSKESEEVGVRKEESQEELWRELEDKVYSNQWFAGDLYNYMKTRYKITRKELTKTE